jgi:inner membrane transporter RhtA
VPPVALVLAAIGSVQFGSALAATLFDDVGPVGAAFVRAGFAAIVLAALWRPRPGGHGRRSLALAALFGAVLGGMNVCFYFSIDRIPLGVAVTFEFVGPLGVAVALSRRPRDLLWVALAGAGIGLLSGGDVSGLDPAGVGLALAAGFLWGSYILLGGRLARAFPGGTGLTLALAVSTLLLLPAAAAGPGEDLLDGHALGIGFAVALLSSAVPYSLELEALRRLPARVFGVLMSLEPALAAVAGFLVLDQSLGAAESVAIALVVVASAGAALTGRAGDQRGGAARRARNAEPSPAESSSKEANPSGSSRPRNVSGGT